MTTMLSPISTVDQIRKNVGDSFADAVRLANEKVGICCLGNNYSTDFRTIWELGAPKIINSRLGPDVEIARRSIGGSPLVDLGCGPKPEPVAKWAMEWGASAYLGIDLFQRTRRLQELGDFPAFVVGQVDMLTYAQCLPERACSVTINAIDESVIPDKSYHFSLSWELIRICRQGGAIFGFGATSLAHLFSNLSPPDSWIHEYGVIRCLGETGSMERTTNTAAGFYVKSDVLAR